MQRGVIEMQNDIKLLLACCHLQSVLVGVGGLSGLTALIASLYPDLYVGVLSDQDFVLKYLCPLKRITPSLLKTSFAC